MNSEGKNLDRGCLGGEDFELCGLLNSSEPTIQLPHHHWSPSSPPPRTPIDEIPQLVIQSPSSPNQIWESEEHTINQKNNTRHIWGFLCYSAAAELYSVVSTSLFLPIILEQFTRDNSYLYPFYMIPCPGSKKFKEMKLNNTIIIDSKILEHPICKAKILGIRIGTATFPLYISSFTVAVQALLVLSISSTADDEYMRKNLLIAFAISGSLAASGFFFLDSSSSFWSLSGVFSLISNVSLGASMVCLNSLLSGISKQRAKIIYEKNSSNGFRIEDEEKFKRIISSCVSDISAKGIAIGFGAGIIALLFCLLIINIYHGDMNIVRWAIGASGLCWALFTFPSALLLPPSRQKYKKTLYSPFHLIKSSKDIWKLLRDYHRLSNTCKFLIVSVLLSNAFFTLISSAVLFSKSVLKMSSSGLIWLGVICPATGIIGALITPVLEKTMIIKFDIKSSKIKLFKALVTISSLLPLYLSCSIFFGSKILSKQIEMYFIAGCFGLVYGAFQSYSRSIYTELLPSGHEAKWYALFSISAKISSSFGPLIVGLITDCTHNMRYGFPFVLSLFILAILILNKVDMETGKIQAENYVMSS